MIKTRDTGGTQVPIESCFGIHSSIVVFSLGTKKNISVVTCVVFVLASQTLHTPLRYLPMILIILRPKGNTNEQ